MQFIGVLRAMGRFLDLHQQALMRAAMLGRPRVPLLFQQPLFAGEVQAREFDQPIQTFTYFVPAFSMDQGQAQFIQRIQQHAMLVIHRLYAG